MSDRSALFLLPRPLEGFILEDFVRPLLESPAVAVLEPGRVPAGALMRLPGPLAAAEAARQARRIRLDRELGVIVAMHAVLQPLAAALLDRNPGAELWYGIWDRYDSALDADSRTRERVGELHRSLSQRADWRFAVSGALAELEIAEGRPTDVLPPPHDSFPTPNPETAVVAASLGHLGRRTDWALLRAIVDAMPELVLILIGEVHPEETPGDPDLAALLEAPGVVMTGRLGDEAAARVLMLADACILPFRREPFNDAGLPQRILKAARLGRRTLVPPLAGARTQAEAIEVCDGTDEWVAALRAARTAGRSSDPGLRSWALDQDSSRLLAPIRERLRKAGVET